MKIIRQKDLIDVISLSKLYATHADMGQGEACEVVTAAIIHSGELIEVYRTNDSELPECIGEVNSKVDHRHVLEAIEMPFKLKWWDNPKRLSVFQAGWGGMPETVAIRRADAARLLEFSFDDEKISRLQASPRQDNASDQSRQEKILGTTERNQLLKMVLGMAINTYRYDPAAKRNEATKQIVDDLSKIGISIDDGTVLKYLKEAATSVSYTMPSKK